jgi:hypothetical protein
MTLPANISSITPVQAQKILAENGLQVTLEQSAGILEFLVKLAQTSICHDEENSLPVHSGEYRRAS